MVHGMTTRVQQLEDVVRRQTDCIRTQVDKIASLENEIAILKGGLEAAGVDAVTFMERMERMEATTSILQVQTQPNATPTSGPRCPADSRLCLRGRHPSQRVGEVRELRLRGPGLTQRRVASTRA
jgi:hypothetical protein